MTKGYKVVRHGRDGVYRSAMGVRAVVEYQVDKETRPKEGNGPLAVFDNLEDAQKFVSFYKPDGVSSIFKCEYELSDEKELWYMIYSGTKATKMTAPGSFQLPRGTVLADTVIITEKVSTHGSY